MRTIKRLKVFAIMVDGIKIDSYQDTATGLYMVNLTQLHKASGESHNRCPAYWLRIQRADRVVKSIAHLNGVGDDAVVRVASTQTEAEAIVALAYAMWISPEFYTTCAAAFRQMFSE